MSERESEIARENNEHVNDHRTAPAGHKQPKAFAETADDVEFERQMSIGREVMRKYKTVLAALAK